MNVHDFLVKWHHPDGQQDPEIEQFDIRLVPSSIFDYSCPTSRLRFEIECVAVVGVCPRVHLTLTSEELGDEPACHMLEKVLDKLDTALNQQIADGRRLCETVARAKPALTVVAGAGFSAAFGLPVTADINALAKQECHNPVSHFEELFPCAHEMYPLKEFFDGDCRFLDFEGFLTLWEGYRHQLYFNADSSLGDHEQCYRYFIQRIGCHFYSHCWEILKSPPKRELLSNLAQWLKDARQKYDVRIVTFNYDVIWEMVCREADLNFTYTETSDEAIIPIWKLHGSINWQQLPDSLVSPNWQLVYSGAGKYVYALTDTTKVPFDESGELPVMIPPIAAKSFKGIYDWIWSFAARDIRRAEKLFVVGYSLPALDAFSQFQLRRLLNLRGKPVRYVVSGNHENRIRRALHGVDLDFSGERWQMQHFTSLGE